VSDILNARSLAIPPGPLTPVEQLLTGAQLGILCRGLREEIEQAALDRARKRRAGLPCVGHARAIAATRATLAEIGGAA